MTDHRQDECAIALYRRLANGDKDALTGLIEIYRTSLTLFIYHITHDMDEAEDLMIDTFVRLVKSPGCFNEKSSFKTYLFSIGRNLAYRRLRKMQKSVPKATGKEYATHISPETELLLDERKQTIFGAMEALKAEHREILCLLYFEDASYAEASAVLKKTETQISSLAYRARAALRKRLEGEGIHEDI